MRTIFSEAFVQFKINCLQELQVLFLINVPVTHFAFAKNYWQ